MKVTFELPDPGIEGIEEAIADQLTQVVASCRALLADYKKRHGIQVPRISLTLPSNLKKVKEITPAQEFVRTLLKHHMERVPTAHAGKQSACLSHIYEAGFTDAEEILKLYNESVESYPATSYFTVQWKLKNGVGSQEKPDDLAFKRKELDESEINSLRNRITVDSKAKV